MKNVSKIMMAIAAIVTATFISSCTETINLEYKNELTIGAESFDAEVESTSITRTSLGTLGPSGYSLVWTSGDKISVSDGTSTAVYSTSGNGTSSASFVWSSGKLGNSASEYTAFYPSAITADNMSLPAEQEYVEGDVKDFPMYAKSSDRTLQFKNLCGIVQFDITDNDEASDYSVSAIHLSCDGKGLSGPFTIGEDHAAVVSAESGVSLKCKTAQALGATAKSFNIVVPAGNYDNLKAVVDFSDGSSRTYQSGGTAKVKRSSIVRYAVSVKASELSGSLELIPVEDGDVDFSER